MNKELEALKKHYIQLANNSSFKYTEFEENRFKLLEKDLEVLEQHKKIEEELGIDLIKTIELCKKVNAQHFVYTKENWGIDKLNILDDLDIELFTCRLYVNSRGIYTSLEIKGYGKTWALTKEELE